MFKLKLVLLIVAAVFFSTQSVMADEALAKSKNCLACHSIDAKIVGPGFKEVAAKYKDDEGAAAALSTKIKSGGSGVWGEIPMPPNPMVSDDEAATLANWILSF